MDPNLSPDDIQTLIAYARDKLEDERPSPRRKELLAKRDSKPEPPAPRKPYVPRLRGGSRD